MKFDIVDKDGKEVPMWGKVPIMLHTGVVRILDLRSMSLEVLEEGHMVRITEKD